jgi:flagellar protein FliO/FliZ
MLDWARAVFALIATLALILGVAFAARRMGMLQPRARGARRLSVSETLMIDPRRRLVVVRFDAREHLILLGPGGDIALGQIEARPSEPQAEPHA